MPKIIEAIYENGVFKPLQKVDLKGGEGRVEDQKRALSFEPIDFGEPIPVGKVKELGDDIWMSS